MVIGKMKVYSKTELALYQKYSRTRLNSYIAKLRIKFVVKKLVQGTKNALEIILRVTTFRQTAKLKNDGG